MCIFIKNSRKMGRYHAHMNFPKNTWYIKWGKKLMWSQDINKLVFVWESRHAFRTKKLTLFLTQCHAFMPFFPRPWAKKNMEIPVWDVQVLSCIQLENHHSCKHYLDHVWPQKKVMLKENKQSSMSSDVNRSNSYCCHSMSYN